MSASQAPTGKSLWQKGNSKRDNFRSITLKRLAGWRSAIKGPRIIMKAGRDASDRPARYITPEGFLVTSLRASFCWLGNTVGKTPAVNAWESGTYLKPLCAFLFGIFYDAYDAPFCLLCPLFSLPFALPAGFVPQVGEITTGHLLTLFWSQLRFRKFIPFVEPRCDW